MVYPWLSCTSREGLDFESGDQGEVRGAEPSKRKARVRRSPLKVSVGRGKPLREKVSVKSKVEMTGSGLSGTLLLVVAVALLVPSRSAAAADQDNDEFLRLHSLAGTGAQVLVVDHAGAETKGKFVNVSPCGLELLLQGRAVEIPREEIAEVRRNGDSLWSGILLGGVFGGGLALAFISDADCETCGLEAGLVLGAGGVALGGLLDYMRRDTRVLYRSGSGKVVPVVTIEPMIKRRKWGLAISWRF